MKIIFNKINYGMFLLVLTGCIAPSYGLRETPLQPRVRHNYDNLGVSIELPNQPIDRDAKYKIEICYSELYQKNTGCKADLYISMYPMWFGIFLAEPEDCLIFRVIRMSAKAFGKFLNGNHCINSDRSIGYDNTTFQSLITEKMITSVGGARTYRCFRKDIKLKDGDYVIISACLNVTLIQREPNHVDIEEIKNIINSVQPLLK